MTTTATYAARMPVLQTAIATLLLAIGGHQVAAAQDLSQAARWQFRIATGSLNPTGIQRGALKRAPVIAAQLSRAISPVFAVTGTFGWARSRDLATTDASKLDIFTADLGIDAHAPVQRISGTLSFVPMVGIGAGMRNYNHRDLSGDATTMLGGYLAAGGEVGIGRVGLLIQVRDYLTNFTPLIAGGRSAVRNDIMLLGSLSLKRHSKDAMGAAR
jgi:hypothetical protein